MCLSNGMLDLFHPHVSAEAACSQVHFESETVGSQTNLTTGKVRRIQKLQKGEPMPAWEARTARARGRISPSLSFCAIASEHPSRSLRWSSQVHLSDTWVTTQRR